MKRNLAIMFAVTANLAFAVGNMIVGLRKHNPDMYDTIVIFHDGIPEDQKAALIQLDERCEFRELTKDQWLRRHFGDDQDMEVQRRVNDALGRYSHFMLVKLDVFDLLKEFRQVLFLDADMLISGDLSPILQHRPMAWREGTKKLIQKFHPFTTEHDDFKGITDRQTIPNGGLIFVTDDLPHEKMLDDAYRFISTYLGKIAYTIDETAFGWVAFRHGISATLLPVKFNRWYGHADESTVITHPIGERKFWNDAVVALAFPQWQENNAAWIAAGGKAYSGPVTRRDLVPTESKNILEVFNNTETWRRAYETIRMSLPVELVPPSNFSKRYFPLHMRGIDKAIHYELRATGEDTFTVALHCEAPLLVKTELWRGKLAEHAGLLPGFNLVATDDRLSLERLRVPLAKLAAVLKTLYSATIVDVKRMTGSNVLPHSQAAGGLVAGSAYPEFTMKLQEALHYHALPRDKNEHGQARQRTVDDLSAAVMQMVHYLKPQIVLEIGAHGAEFSRSVKLAMPDARVVAFEANPGVHGRYREEVEALGVEYHFQCIADENRTYRFNVPATTKEHSTMGSLLTNQRAPAESTYEVQGQRLDDFLGEDGLNNAMWVDVEGAVGSVLAGAEKSLQKCILFFAELEASPRWEGQVLDREVIQQLAGFGLFPVLRDIQRHKWQHNIVFLRQEALTDPAILSICSEFFKKTVGHVRLESGNRMKAAAAAAIAVLPS
ncbi:FkbM family methyltransferase [Rhizobium sp. NTR19]|uniref:FkbM family methyltransferase n=1 Tax=Neorhizobium turbinariae TaxID=2937795 RepID=A0ABT0IRU1_9HYPH|nr:FkbM family methyltransferase [Neorhizobium turbinariae]MCK8780573.1 FkbM family methyltransferase [Neorhizobium turbinariae]